MLRNLFDQIPAACQNPCLWAAKQLVAAEGYKVCSFCQKLLNLFFSAKAIGCQIHKTAASKIHQKGDFVAVSCLGKLFHGWFMGEACDLIVAGVNLEERGGIFCHRILVIFQISAVGGSHFHKGGSALAAYVRDPEFAADFHKLSSGHNGLPTKCQRCQHYKHRCRVVIDCKTCLCTCQPAQIFRKMIVSAAPLPILQVHFQVGVSGHKGHKLKHQLFSQRCTSKIGMQDHARCIDHPLHPPLILPG